MRKAQDSMDEAVSAAGAPYLKRLEQLRDVRLGLNVFSHRAAPIGPLLVLTKKTFRRAFQPFINELMRKQALFNEDLVNWAQTVYRDIRSLESASLASRASLERRIEKLEAALEKQAGGSTNALTADNNAQVERHAVNGSPSKN